MSDLNNIAERVRKDAERKKAENSGNEAILDAAKTAAAEIIKTEPVIEKKPEEQTAAPSPATKETTAEQPKKEDEDEVIDDFADLAKPLPTPVITTDTVPTPPSPNNTDLSKFEHNESETVVMGGDEKSDDEDAPTIIASAPPTSEKKEEVKEGSDTNLMSDEEFFKDDESAGNVGVNLELTDETIAAAMPKVPEEEAVKYYDGIRKEVQAYRQQLILKNGLPSEDANALAINKMKSLAEAKEISYLKDHPDKLVVTVNKEDAKNLEFTEEEKKKLEKVKVIKLEEVEVRTVETSKVKKFSNKRSKLEFLQKLDGPAISTYAVPLPAMYDFVSFKGTQLIQLLQAVRYDDITYDEVVSKKAGLVYNQMINGTHLRKTDANGKGNMPFSDFTKIFRFHDLDMALFGIFVASSVEDVESSLACADCRSTFTWKWNVKEVLDADGFTEEYKERMDDILKHKSNGPYLKTKFNEIDYTKAVKSPLTNYVYYLDAPSVERVVRIFSTIDQQDEAMVYLTGIAMFINKMLMPIKGTDEFVEITEEESDILLEQAQSLPQEELDMIIKFVQPMFYQPKFSLKSKCPNCGFEMTNALSVEDLVFLQAQGSSTETR